MNIGRYKMRMKDLLRCDQAWVDRATKRCVNKKMLNWAFFQRNDLYNSVDYVHDRLFIRYERMWDRLRDLNIDTEAFVSTEKKIIENIGFGEVAPNLAFLLNRIKVSLEDVARWRLNSRQYEYVFNGRVKH